MHMVVSNSSKLMANALSFSLQRLKSLCTPTQDLPQATIKKTSNHEAFQTFTGLFTLRTTETFENKVNRAQRTAII